MGIIDYVKLLRPQQWYKNLLVFLPVIFVGKALEMPLLWVSFLAFVSLCLCSSFNYIVNDIVDRKKDRAHPEKRTRPIAAGKVPIWTAVIIALVLLALGLRLAYVLDVWFFYAAVTLVVLTQIYSFYLKHIAFADILTVAFNFVLRAGAGALVLKAAISPWLVLCTFFSRSFCSQESATQTLSSLAQRQPATRKHSGFTQKTSQTRL